jgi:hypothetical protein
VHLTVAENELVMLKWKKGRNLRDKLYPLSAFASHRPYVSSSISISEPNRRHKNISQGSIEGKTFSHKIIIHVSGEVSICKEAFVGVHMSIGRLRYTTL